VQKASSGDRKFTVAVYDGQSAVVIRRNVDDVTLEVRRLAKFVGKVRRCFSLLTHQRRVAYIKTNSETR